MINVQEIITDPDFCQTFTVSRSSGDFGKGGWAESTPTTITMIGVVTVANEKDMQQVPEADRVMGAMMFHSTEAIYTTRAKDTPATSDKIQWRGEWYRVAKVWPLVDYGFYKAYAYRMTGN